MNFVVSEVELCLCSRCANAFYGSSVHRIYRSDPHQVIKHECDFCRIHRGFDFQIRKLPTKRMPVVLR